MSKPISSRLQVEDGSIPAKSKQKQPIKGFQSLTAVQGRFKPQRVTSSTTASLQANSEAMSDEAQTAYGELGLSGQDRHMLAMLESPDISTAEANQHLQSYYG
jgi:hypothetical protein